MDDIRDIDSKAAFDHLIERVKQGEEVLLTEDGRPVARLVQPPPPFDLDAAKAAVARIKERSKSMSLAPDTIADLKHMGHKY